MNPETIERADAGSTGSSQTSPASPAAGTISASIVTERDDGEAVYKMFEVHELSPDGAFLSSWLFLELHEEITVELSMGDETLRLRAQVEGLHKGEAPGMEVKFLDLNDEQRALLASNSERNSEASS